MKVLSLFCLGVVVSAPLYAQSISPKTLQEAETYNPYQLQGFKQTENKLIDPAGDYALLKRSELVPKRIVWDLLNLKDNEPPFPENHEDWEDLVVSQGHSETPEAKAKNPIQGKENPINRKGFSSMINQIIVEELENGIVPSIGTPHVWSKEFLAKYGKTHPMLVSSKLLMALAVGETNRYMKTGTEKELYQWLLNSDDNGLELSDVIRASYKLNKGDMYLTILTIENVLAHQWHNEKREKLPFIKKLKPITSGNEYTADKFGTWYHLFGIMLYGYVEGGLKSSLIGRIEALGSNMLSPGVDKTQKQWMNKIGGLLGSDIAKIVRNEAYLKHQSNTELLREVSYLNKTEDFRDRIKYPLDRDIAVTISKDEDRTNVEILDKKNRNFENCRVEVFPSNGRGFNVRKKEMRENVSLSRSALTIQFLERDVSRVRGFISCENEKETIVFESK